MQGWDAVLLLWYMNATRGRTARVALPRATGSSSSRALWKLARYAGSCQVGARLVTLMCLAHG